MTSNVVPFTPKVDPGALKDHEAASLFPMMAGEELAKLAEDIGKYGLRHAVTLFRRPDGEFVVLDGRNRILACKMTGEKIRFDVLPEGKDPVAYVVSTNLARRHLNESQRAMVAARMATLPRGRNNSSANLPMMPTQAQAAEKLGVGVRTVRSARVVLNSGSEELVRAVEGGEVAVSVAATIASLPEGKRRDALVDATESKRTNRSVDHDARRGRVVELHESGMGTREIARAMGVDPTAVSKVKVELGIASNSVPNKLWADVDHLVSRLSGATPAIEKLAGEVAGVTLNASEEEIKSCIRRLTQAMGSIRRLNAALRAARSNGSTT